jgi:hypothetical protein
MVGGCGRVHGCVGKGAYYLGNTKWGLDKALERINSGLAVV